MGICCSNLTDDQRQAIQQSTALDKIISNHQTDDNKIIKLLLLGTGESGKSTIFKQMQILYQSGFSDFEKSTFRHVIRRNAVEAMQTLLHGVQKFGLTLASPSSEEAARFILALDPLSADFWVAEIVDATVHLWRDPAVQGAYQQRSKLQLLDSTEYLVNNIARIGQADYLPTRDDILRARLRTSGIVERIFNINNVLFRFLDVGGQRNERRKWIHCFEGCTAVIFVAAISEYDQVLYEDEKENRLKESVRVFESICNNRYFEKTAMILFLNKIDLFREKITRVPLNVCFEDYTGPNTEEDAAAFITRKFVETNQRPDKMIFTHVTCATDTNNVQRVFDACKLVILQGNLDKLGLY